MEHTIVSAIRFALDIGLKATVLLALALALLAALRRYSAAGRHMLAMLALAGALALPLIALWSPAPHVSVPVFPEPVAVKLASPAQTGQTGHTGQTAPAAADRSAATKDDEPTPADGKDASAAATSQSASSGSASASENPPDAPSTSVEPRAGASIDPPRFSPCGRPALSSRSFASRSARGRSARSPAPRSPCATASGATPRASSPPASPWPDESGSSRVPTSPSR